MSELLTIVPPDWTEVLAINDLINDGALATQEVFTAISVKSWADIDTMLINCGMLPDGENTSNARLIYADTGYRFWAQFSAATPV